MKIVIDDVMCTIDEWEDGTTGSELLRVDSIYFYSTIDKILTHSQRKRFIENETCRIFILSLKQQKILSSLIKTNKK